MNKDVRKLITSLERIDDVNVQMDAGHPIVTKGGQFVCTLPTTPSDSRWMANTLAQLRRAGITPATKPEKLSRPPKTLSLETIAQRLKPIREERKMAEFCRFTQQLAEVRGFRGFKTIESAESTVPKYANKEVVRPAGWVLVWMSEGLAEWSRWRQAKTVAVETDMPAEVIVAESLPREATGPRLVVDLSRLASKLAEFGIELEVR